MNRSRERTFREASAICYHTSSLSHPSLLFFSLINRSERWEEDILSWQRVPRDFNQTLLHHSYSFSLTGQRDRGRKRERADDVQAKPQLIAFQFACKCWTEAEWRLGEKLHSSPLKGRALATHNSLSQIILLTIDKPQTYQRVNLHR